MGPRSREQASGALGRSLGGGARRSCVCGAGGRGPRVAGLDAAAGCGPHSGGSGGPGAVWRLPPARREGQPGLSRAVLQAVGRPGRPCAPSCLRSAMPSAPRCDLCISFCQDKPAGPRPTGDSDRGTHSRRPRGKAGACSEPFLIPSPLCHCGQERSRCGQRRDHPELGDQGLNTENPTCVRSPCP